jgi:hypothetical protein
MGLVQVKNVRRICEILLILFVVAYGVGILPFSVDNVRAQGNAIEAEIHPSQGIGSTDILIRFYTRNASIGNVDKADFFWDDVSIELNKAGIQSADGSYNYWLKVPSEHPLSDVGNHTIRVDSFVWNYGQVSFNFTFEITEFVPGPEYVALNATYYSILANYSDLLNHYASLSVNYSKLFADYNTFLSEHSSLLSNYNSLSANYNSFLANYNALSANYNSLQSNYNNLHSLYSLFLANYTSLVGNQNSLTYDYNTLRADYTSLESSYHDLKINYDSLVGEQSTSRNLNYIFIASTIILAATTVYLASSKQKPPSRTR